MVGLFLLVLTMPSITLSTTLYDTSIIFYALNEKGYKKDSLRRFLNKCDVWVVKKTQNSNSKPCMKCLQKLKNAGIRRIYYTDGDKIIVEKASKMETTHLSSKYRRPWNLWP